MNKSKFFLLGMLAILLTFGLVLTGCGDAGGGPTGTGDPELSGDITISPESSVTTGTELTATYSGSETVTYQWIKDGTAIDGETNQTYTPTETGSYTVTVSAAGYLSKTSAAVTVTGASLSDLSGDITISPDSDVTTGTELTATYSGSETVTYQWIKDGTAIFGETNQTYTPTETGSYTVTVSAAGYQSKTSAAVTVTGATLPDLSGDITISPDSGVTTGTELTATYSGSETVTYQWIKDGTAIDGEINQTYTPSEAGSYTVTVSASGYQSKTSAAVTVPITESYTVTFDVDGGSAVDAQTITEGGKATRPTADPTKSGFSFDNWYTTNAFATLYDFDAAVNSNITIYAKWLSLEAAKAELQTAIDAATATKNAARVTATAWVEGTLASGTYIANGSGDALPVGLYYLAADPTVAYTTAITTATTALSTAATVADVDAAKADLATATSTFETVLASATQGTLGLAARVAAASTGTTIYLYGDENIAGITTTVNITLEGVGGERTITLSSNGFMFRVNTGSSLTLNANVTLKGKSGNNEAVVLVGYTTSTFTMNAGSKITGNSNSGDGGGVRVAGTFNLDGGTISGNTASISGGGVNINSGTFNLSSGTISGNTANGAGGGVSITTSGGVFNQSGGTISGNKANTSGGGVYVPSSASAKFYMAGGTITADNTANNGRALYKQANGVAKYGTATEEGDFIVGTATTVGSSNGPLTGHP
ncbi:hypothetical protein AGMMS50293_27180 [Spirochaetia bacterium]|nr:hypothetical protein AGMMS50293_27180 [Spirochaetia bacterium]